MLPLRMSSLAKFAESSAVPAKDQDDLSAWGMGQKGAEKSRNDAVENLKHKCSLSFFLENK